MRYAARTDANKTEIVDALRSAGFNVYDLRHPVDLLVWISGKPGLLAMELKDGKKPPSARTLTEGQKKVLDAGMPMSIVTDVEGALRAARMLHAAL